MVVYTFSIQDKDPNMVALGPSAVCCVSKSVTVSPGNTYRLYGVRSSEIFWLMGILNEISTSGVVAELLIVPALESADASDCDPYCEIDTNDDPTSATPYASATVAFPNGVPLLFWDVVVRHT